MCLIYLTNPQVDLPGWALQTALGPLMASTFPPLTVALCTELQGLFFPPCYRVLWTTDSSSTWTASHWWRSTLAGLSGILVPLMWGMFAHGSPSVEQVRYPSSKEGGNSFPFTQHLKGDYSPNSPSLLLKNLPYLPLLCLRKSYTRHLDSRKDIISYWMKNYWMIVECAFRQLGIVEGPEKCALMLISGNCSPWLLSEILHNIYETSGKTFLDAQRLTRAGNRLQRSRHFCTMAIRRFLWGRPQAAQPNANTTYLIFNQKRFLWNVLNIEMLFYAPATNTKCIAMWGRGCGEC